MVIDINILRVCYNMYKYAIYKFKLHISGETYKRKSTI